MWNSLVGTALTLLLFLLTSLATIIHKHSRIHQIGKINRTQEHSGVRKNNNTIEEDRGNINITDANSTNSKTMNQNSSVDVSNQEKLMIQVIS